MVALDADCWKLILDNASRFVAFGDLDILDVEHNEQNLDSNIVDVDPRELVGIHWFVAFCSSLTPLGSY